MKILIPLILIGLSGCAGEMAARESMKTIGSTAEVLANKIPITEGNMDVDGDITNPKYTVMAGMFNGAIVTIELSGVTVRGRMYGQGTGGSNKIDPELAQIIRENRNEPKVLADKIAEYLLNNSTARAIVTTQPSK